MKAIYCDLFLLPQLCQILQDELPSRYHIIAQQWLDLCLGKNIFSVVKTLQDLNVLERQSGGAQCLPDREWGKKSRSPLIGSNKNSSSRWDPLFNSTYDKLRTCIPIQMGMQASFNSKSVLPVFYFITTTNMDGIIITKECFNLWTWIWSELDSSMQINVF